MQREVNGGVETQESMYNANTFAFTRFFFRITQYNADAHNMTHTYPYERSQHARTLTSMNTRT